MIDLFKLKIWIKALRIPFLTVTIVPIILGSVIAYNETGHLNWLNFILALMGGSFIHMGLNLCNDYFDHISGNDEANSNPTPFSGGSRVIQDRLLPANSVLFASIRFFALGGMIGLYLNYIILGNVILGIGIIGICIAIFYTAPPLSLGYRGFGEIFVGLGFGPLMVLGSYYVQKQSLSVNPVWASIPVGVLTALILYINEFPDYSADASVNKKTVVVKMGKKKAAELFNYILLSSYVLILSGILLKFLPLSSLVVLLTIPLAIYITSTLKENHEKIQELLPANAGMIRLHLIFGLLLIASYLANSIIKG
jgi:1,4-dihydroxy-2-naphthoate octaprenyltransferase